MQIHMHNPPEWDPGKIRGFLENSQGLEFEAENRQELYAWIQATLVAQEYFHLKKKERGLIRAYLHKVSRLSLAHLARLIRQYRRDGAIRSQTKTRRRFPATYTPEDVALLAETDRLHQRLSGPATRCLFQRAWKQFGDARYERLAGISVSHLYNLRRRNEYRRQCTQFDSTKPVQIQIGERRRPDPRDRPGYLRVDTVHQGDWDGAKGVYHINAVDAVTQWEVLGCVTRISEHYLLPVLEAMLHQFPFRILGFHTDNGSEYINHSVDQLLKRLLVEFTKSRAAKSQDNALVEGKNGAIVRKHMEWGHIPGEHAELVHKFYTAQFNPYLNYHRPCGFATVTVDAQGKRQRAYKHDNYATPYEKLKSLPHAESYLKPDHSFAKLDLLARTLSDTESARRMQSAKQQLLRTIKIESPFPPKF
jgi:transposase InsO family protein